MNGGGEDGAPAPGAEARGAPLASLLHLLAVAALGLAAYANSFDVPFHLDDFHAVARNPLTRDLESFFREVSSPIRSVAYLSFALNGSLGGRSVAGYHLLNLAIHVAAAGLVYLLARFALPRAAPPGSPAANHAGAAALVAAALFVAHPVQTEAVTYVVQRMTSLAALFSLGAVATYAFAAVARGTGRRAVLTGAALLLTLLALLTKENAAALPLALAAFDACFLPGGARERVRRLAPFVVVVGGIALFALSPVAGVAGAAAEARAHARTAEEAGWGAHLLTQPRVILTYLRLLAVPVGQNVDHDVPISTAPLDASVLVSTAALCALLLIPAAAAWRRRERGGMARGTLFAIAWFLGTLSVETIVPLADVLAEHRLYLPSVGPFILAGAAVATALGRAERSVARALAWAVGATVVVLAIATFTRNEVWRDRRTLWSDALRKSPEKPRAYGWVAQDLMDRGDHAGAVALLERAATLKPAYARTFMMLANGYGRLGRLAEAERAFRVSLAIEDSPRVRFGLAMLLLGKEDIAGACEQFFAIRALAPEMSVARADIVPCLYRRGDVAEGLAEAERLAREGPDDPVTVFNVAEGHAGLGHLAEARRAYLRFLELERGDMAPERERARAWLESHRQPVRSGAPKPGR